MRADTADARDLLVRVKIGRNLPACRRLADGSYLSRIGSLEVRVITATITVTTDTGHRREHRSQTYLLITLLVIYQVIRLAISDAVLTRPDRSWHSSMPQWRSRSNPRVVKRAISVYAANTAQARIRAPSRTTTTTIRIRIVNDHP